MQLTDHVFNAQDEYHFETSDEYCDRAMVAKADEYVRNTLKLTEADLAQLETIVRLESLRFAYAHGERNIVEHAQDIQALRNNLIKCHQREPFDNGAIEAAFYRALNREYGYVE